MAINYKQFETQSGFKSPGFTVDTAGNVVVRTLTQTFIPEAASPAPDYSINENGGPEQLGFAGLSWLQFATL